MFELVATSYFQRRLERFKRTHPGLADELAQLFKALEEDPFQPVLRFHRLAGRLAGLGAVRLTYDIRVVCEVDAEAKLITLVNIGTHEEVYR
jgi:mRNA interferase YafQ